MAVYDAFKSILVIFLFFCCSSDVLQLYVGAQSDLCNGSCLNGGSCFVTTAAVPHCMCPDGFTGRYCELFCRMTCLNGGVCIATRDNSSSGVREACICHEDFIGQMCEETATYFFFEMTGYAAPEERRDVVVTVVRTGDLNKVSTVQFGTKDLNATAGSDYYDNSMELRFLVSESHKDVTISIVDDSLDERSEEFVVFLFLPEGGSLQYPSETAVIHILDNDVNQIQIFPLFRTLTVSEVEGSVSVTLLRSGGINRAVDIFVSTVGGGTTFPPASTSDYSAFFNVSMRFEPFEYVKEITVVIYDNFIVQGDREFLVEYVWERPEETVIGQVSIIIEDDEGTVPLIGIDQTYVYFGHLPYYAVEGDTLEIPVFRLGNLSMSTVVEIYTFNGSAVEPVDYWPEYRMIEMRPFMSSVLFPILINHDDEFESTGEEFYVTMNVLRGGILGRPQERTVAVNIRPDAITPDNVRVSMTEAFKTVFEGQGEVVITISREGYIEGLTSVVVSTEGGTATSSVDFMALETVVYFPPQISLQTVTVAIEDDVDLEGSENFFVHLGRVDFGTVVEPRSVEITILDDDGTVSSTGVSTTRDQSPPSPPSPPPPDYTIYIIVAVVVVVALVVFAVIIIAYFRWREPKERGSADEFPLANRKLRAHSNSYLNRGSPVPLTKGSVTPMREVDPDTREYPREKLRFYEEIGSGAFATVYRAEAMGIQRPGLVSTVAVKMLKKTASESDKSDFLKELAVFKLLDPHPNVMSMLGCCTTCEPLYLILEFMPHGNLQSYLQRIRTGKEKEHPGYLDATKRVIQPDEVLKFGSEISRGMEYLASKECIHRDLATRNILLSEDYVCKVSDFGLAREVAGDQQYEMKSKGRVPVRWLAPECLLHNQYTSLSDVWSFGVLMWELVTLGSHPYPGMSSQEVIRQVQRGYRLPKPDHCSQEIYDMMASCWATDPEKRPTFQTLRMRIETMLADAQGYLSMDGFREQDYIYMTPGQESDEADKDALTSVKVDSQRPDGDQTEVPA